MKILNVFITLTLKQIFWKKETFPKKLGQLFLIKSTKTENASSAISEYQRSMLRQIGPITKDGNLPVNTLFF